jgi:hypothetical protein
MRTIIVGDVHGCTSELETLLDKLAFETGDRLVFVGDLIVRGPDNLGVLDIVRSTGAIFVRGNHEQRLLVIGPQAQDDDDARRSSPEKTVGKLHRDVARELRPVDWTLLANSKPSLDLPEHGVRVVHAGLDPSVPFEEQSPDTLMRIRTVRSGDRDVLWGACYTGPPHVVFGHNAAPGLQLHPWATGLDTGCVYGGRLTALVLREGEHVPQDPAERHALLVSVPARRMWFAPTSRSPAEG